MNTDMRIRAGWTEITCEESNRIKEAGVDPVSSLTDPDGNYGAPVIYTEWAAKGSDVPVLRDYLHHPYALTASCEHLVPAKDKT